MADDPSANTARRDPQVGDFLGHYRLDQLLGAGGMGVVFKAHEEALNRYVAIKVLSHKLSADQEFVQRFLHEAQAIAALNHPNITQIYYIAQQENILFFAMEFVEGMELDTLLRSRQRLEPRQAVELIRQAAHGLQHAHKHGVIHRDIKPANLMLTSEGIIKVCDFGLAKEVSTEAGLTTKQTVMGTPYYMSPEQAKGESVDHRSDIYSLGATLYQLLAGRPPFMGDSSMAIMIHHIQSPLPPIQQFNPAIPTAINMILHKAMAKQTSARYQSYAELIRDLDNFLAAPSLPPPVAEPVEVPQRSFMPTFVLVALAVALGWFFVKNLREKDSPLPPQLPQPIVVNDGNNPPPPPLPTPPSGQNKTLEEQAENAFRKLQSQANELLTAGSFSDADTVYASSWPNQFRGTQAWQLLNAERTRIRDTAAAKWTAVHAEALVKRKNNQFSEAISLYDDFVRRVMSFETLRANAKTEWQKTLDDKKAFEERQVVVAATLDRDRDARFQAATRPIITALILTQQFEKAQQAARVLSTTIDADLKERIPNFQNDVDRLVILKQAILARWKDKPSPPMSITITTGEVKTGEIVKGDADSFTLERKSAFGSSSLPIPWASVQPASAIDLFRISLDPKNADELLAYALLLQYHGQFADARVVLQSALVIDPSKGAILKVALGRLDERESAQREMMAAELWKQIQASFDAKQWAVAQAGIVKLKDKFANTQVVEENAKDKIPRIEMMAGGWVAQSKELQEKINLVRSKGNRSISVERTGRPNTLEAAIKEARSGDLIVLGEGVYPELIETRIEKLDITASPGTMPVVSGPVRLPNPNSWINFSGIIFTGLDKHSSEPGLLRSIEIGPIGDSAPTGTITFTNCAFLSEGIIINRMEKVSIEKSIFSTSGTNVTLFSPQCQFTFQHNTIVAPLLARERTADFRHASFWLRHGFQRELQWRLVIENNIFARPEPIFAFFLQPTALRGGRNRLNSDYNYFRPRTGWPIAFTPGTDETNGPNQLGDLAEWQRSSQHDANSLSVAAPGFVEDSAGNYRLRADSPCIGKANDTTNLGVIWNELQWEAFENTVRQLKAKREN